MRFLTALFLIPIFGCHSQSFDQEIVLINVEELRRADIANLIYTINAFEPKVIAVDIRFDPTNDDKANNELANAIWNCNNVVVPTIAVEIAGNIDFVLCGPGDFVNRMSLTGFVNALLEDDQIGTLRSFTVWERNNQWVDPEYKYAAIDTEYHFGVKTAMVYDSLKAMRFVKMHAKVVEIDYKNGKRKFRKHDGSHVLHGGLTKGEIQGKIVMLGFLGPGNEDKFYTPMNSKKKKPDMYGVEYLANIVAQVLESK